MFQLIIALTALLIQQTLAGDSGNSSVVVEVVTATCTVVAAENGQGFAGVLKLVGVVGENITVTGNVKNNAVGTWKVNQNHAVVVHEASIAAGVATACAGIGAHYNAAGNKHGAIDNVKNNRHNGDWSNAVTDVNGDLQIAIADLVFTDLNDLAGRSIGIYNLADDGKTDPIGNAGVVVACCNIEVDGVPTPTYTVAPPPVAKTTGQWQPDGCDVSYPGYAYPWPWYWVPPAQSCTPHCWTPGPGIAAPSWWVPPYGYPYTTTTTAKTTTAYDPYYTVPPTAAPTPPPTTVYYGPGYYAPPPPPPTNAPTPPVYCYDCYYNTVQCTETTTACIRNYYNQHICPASQSVLALLATLVAVLALVF